MSIIDDFADIAKRMKGELAPKPRVEDLNTTAQELAASLSKSWMGQAGPPLPQPAADCLKYICIPCLGSGIDPRPIGGSCPDCFGRGWTHTP